MFRRERRAAEAVSNRGPSAHHWAWRLTARPNRLTGRRELIRGKIAKCSLRVRSTCCWPLERTKSGMFITAASYRTAQPARPLHLWWAHTSTSAQKGASRAGENWVTVTTAETIHWPGSRLLYKIRFVSVAGSKNRTGRVPGTIWGTWGTNRICEVFVCPET